MIFHTKYCGRLDTLAAQQKPGYCRVSALEILLTILFQTLTNLCRRHSCSQLLVLEKIVRIMDASSTSSSCATSRSLTSVTVRSYRAFQLYNVTPVQQNIHAIRYNYTQGRSRKQTEAILYYIMSPLHIYGNILLL